MGLFVPFGLLWTYALANQKKTAGGFLLALVLGVALALSLQIALTCPHSLYQFEC